MTVFSIGSSIMDALRISFGMFWEILWALILGFALSGVVQAWIPRERLERALRRICLPLAERLRRMRDLALEVRGVDAVVVDDADATDAGGCEIEAGRTAEPARADQEHARLQQLQLALDADLGNQQVAAVPRALLRVERVGELRREAVAFPVGEATGERDDILVAEVG